MGTKLKKEEWQKSERVIRAAKAAAKREGVVLVSIVVKDAEGTSKHSNKKG